MTGYEKLEGSGTELNTEQNSNSNKLNKGRVLSSLSFLNLNKDEQEFLRSFFLRKIKDRSKENNLESYQDIHQYKGDYKEVDLVQELVDAFRNRRFLSLTLDYHLNKLKAIDPVLFQYQTIEELNAQEDDLFHAYYVLYTQYQIELTEYTHKASFVSKRLAQLQQCVSLIEKVQNIRTLKSSQKESPEFLDALNNLYAQHGKYIVLGAALDLSQIMTGKVPTESEGSIEPDESQELLKDSKELSNKGNTGISQDSFKETFFTGLRNLVSIINYANWERLFWVWGREFLSACINFTYEVDSHHYQRSQGVLDAPAPVSGTISYVYYFARLFANTLLIFKPKIRMFMNGQEALVKSHLDILEEEGQLTEEEKINYVWQERKWLWWNDVIWGPTNLVCYWKLNYENTETILHLKYGFWGDVLSCFLLVFDLTVSYLRYQEALKTYETNLQNVDTEIANLENEINNFLYSSVLFKEEKDIEIATESNHAEVLLERLHNLKEFRKNLIEEWKNEQKELMFDIGYACALAIGLLLLCFLTILPIGSIMCVTVTLLYMGLRDGFNMQDTVKVRDELRVALGELEDKLSAANENNNENEKAKLQRQIASLKHELEYQEDLVAYNQLKLAGTMVLSVLVPAGVLAMILFPPAAGLVIAVWVLAYATPLIFNITMSTLFKPRPVQLEDNKENLITSLVDTDALTSSMGNDDLAFVKDLEPAFALSDADSLTSRISNPENFEAPVSFRSDADVSSSPDLEDDSETVPLLPHK